MSIENPTTYGEWYWKQQFESELAIQTAYEKEIAPVTRAIMGNLQLPENLPPAFAPLFAVLQEPSSPAWGSILGRFASEMADGVLNQTLGHALKDFNYTMAAWFRDLRIDFPTASILWSRRKISEDMFDARMESEGFKPEEGAAFYEAQRPYPTLPEIFLWARYHGDPDNIRGTVWEKFDVSVDDFDMWEWLSWQRLTTEQVQTLYKRGQITEGDFYAEISRIGWPYVDRDNIRQLAYTLPNAMLTIQGNLLRDTPQEEILKDISKADIHPDYASLYYDAVLTKPASIDMVNYLLRVDPNLTRLETELRRLGIHPQYTEVYKTLAYQIPPVADIITMAVREAFTPDIAARFGQYEDFPEQLEYYAAQKGLSSEWAQRYWASHWSLPSPQQGYEMLHRGIINEEELALLLRALDVMPFWRNKLIQMSYKLLTRVDIRRMYGQGVLDEEEVYNAYRAAGYDDTNAQRMTLFTVKQTLSSQAKFTSRDVVTAYSKRLIDRNSATQLLRMLDIRREDIDFILSASDYKRQWEFTEQQIKGIRNLYKRKVYSENDARDKLARLDLPADQIDVLLQQWFYEVIEEGKPTWTKAETLRFVKEKKIDRKRAQTELEIMGYDEEHIQLYLEGIE